MTAVPHAEPVLHRRQFVIWDERYAVSEWRHVDLGVGRHLSWHPELTVDELPGGRGYVLGMPVVDGACGRYVIIEDGKLRGAHGCLFAVHFGAADGRGVISSSPRLAADLLGTARKDIALRWGRGINWFPSPGSPFDGVSRLLFDQEIDIRTLAVTHRPRTIEPWGSAYIGAGKLAEHIAAICQSVPGKPVLALTAGLDSRVLLAALLATGVRFTAITMRVSEGTRVDIEIARRLAARYGFEHRVVEPVAAREADQGERDLALWRAHTAGSVSDADDNRLVPGRQYRCLGPEDVVLRGGCFELGRRFFHRRLARLPPVPDAEEIERRFDGPPFSARGDRSLDAWIEWRLAHPVGLSLVDSFYLDQRIGGWLAAIEQGLDIYPFMSLHPANSDAAFAALTSYEHPREARDGRIQRLAARSMCRDILDMPVNPRPIRARLYHGAIRLRAMLRRRSE